MLWSYEIWLLGNNLMKMEQRHTSTVPLASGVDGERRGRCIKIKSSFAVVTISKNVTIYRSVGVIESVAEYGVEIVSMLIMSEFHPVG